MHRLVADIELAENGVGLPHLHPGSREICIRAGRDDDLVLAVVRDEDQRDARMGVRVVDRADPLQVDAGFLESGEGLVGKIVDGDHAREADGGAEPGRGDGLVRPFPPGTRSNTAPVTVSPSRGSARTGRRGRG